MLAIERRNEILEKLQVEKRVVVSELSQRYRVSEETIRRDLDKLEKDGLVTKSYGGAVLNEHSVLDLPFNVRKNQRIVEKQKIAAQIEDLIADGEAVMLDASSTAVYIAKSLRKKKKLTVITNSIEIIIGLFDLPEWNVVSTGGILLERSFALVGPGTNQAIGSYHVDKAVICCKGLTMENGLTDSDPQDAESKRMMLKAAKERILVLDHTKYGKAAFTRVAGLEDIDKIVTDQRPPEEWMREFDRLGIECIYPEE